MHAKLVKLKSSHSMTRSLQAICARQVFEVEDIVVQLAVDHVVGEDVRIAREVAMRAVPTR